MKLIDGDRLLKLMAGGGDPDYAHHLETNLFPKCTLDPADLDKMNLAALRVLENLKISLEDMKTGLSKRHPGRTINVEVGAIFELIHTLESAADLKESFAKAQDKPDYKAIVKEIEEYMHKEEYRLRMEGYAMISGASRGENFLRELKAKHTPVSRETDVREKPEVKDDSNK